MVAEHIQKRRISGKVERNQLNIPKAQETIYNYLIEIVKTWPPEDVLGEFDQLFIQHANTVSSDTLPSLYEIVFANQEQEFRNTLKRSCYILINNWDLARHHASIRKLIQLFESPIIAKPTMSPTLRRMRQWLKNFVDSDDYAQLCLFAARYDEKHVKHWSERYTSYLLVPQYIDLNNPAEQRHAARALSKQLKEKFKFDLAMYTARSQLTSAIEKPPANPTSLGDDVLRLIKIIVVRKGKFSYTNIANIFLKQTQNARYTDFKRSFLNYLLFSIEDNEVKETLRTQLSDRLQVLYAEHQHLPIDDALLLRTCNRTIEFLTTETHEEPSPLFIQLLSRGNPLTLVVLLLKIILVCRYARTNLEARIADLVHYYKDCTEDECQWVIQFFEIFDITMTIHAENVEFNLVNMGEEFPPSLDEPLSEGQSYRIFSQVKGGPTSEQELDAIEQKIIDMLSLDQMKANGAEP
ncbi:hypothetical protein ACQ4M4_26315 [Leptolyngbya sp. AN02str]|uniref:hypothetical protein n=1 Tax=Leptolyngbya sp. AN02str TaxID=3423363 RepID=UPI003D314589